MAEAHRRGIKVLVDMVLNHAPASTRTSRRRCATPASRRTATGSASRPRWGEGPLGRRRLAQVAGARRVLLRRVLERDAGPELRHPRRARGGQPKVADFWLRRWGWTASGSTPSPTWWRRAPCSPALPGTHRVLRDYAAHVRGVRPDAFTVGEVWDSVGAMLPYYPDQLDSYFAFELADALINAVNRGSAEKMLDGYLRLQRAMPATAGRPSCATTTRPAPSPTWAATGEGAGGGHPPAHPPRRPLPLLRRGDRDDRRQAQRRRAAAHAHAVERAAARRLHHRHALGGAAADWATVTWRRRSRPRSLLNLHRRLIHLRAANPALAGGRAGAAHRRSGAGGRLPPPRRRRAVLVVANLGATPRLRRRARLGGRRAGGRAVRARDLLGPAAAAPLRWPPTGGCEGYVPLPTLGPLQVHVSSWSVAAR
jgi:hypothetical protein